MALFKKNPLSKKSTGAGLFARAKPKLHKKHGSADDVPPAGFPTSEDLRMNDTQHHVEETPSDDDRFLLYGERRSLNSSNVAWAEYSEERQELHVGFHNGGSGFYEQVSPNVALGLIQAESPGTYLRQVLRDVYTWRKAS